jgi:glutamine phosphoribosylpyrophosphate amidotransferase
MKKILPDGDNYDFCTACFDNQYPICFPDEATEQMELSFA